MKYTQAGDHIVLAMNSETREEAMARFAAAYDSVDRELFTAELSHANQEAFPKYQEEARRTDNADGTDGDFPHMPEGWDHSSNRRANPEDIVKPDGMDEYPSTRQSFLQNGDLDNLSEDSPNPASLAGTTGIPEGEDESEDDPEAKKDSDKGDHERASTEQNLEHPGRSNIDLDEQDPKVMANRLIDQIDGDDELEDTSDDALYMDDDGDEDDDILNSPSDDFTVFDDPELAGCDEDDNIDDDTAEEANALNDMSNAPQYPLEEVIEEEDTQTAAVDFPAKAWEKEESDTDVNGDDSTMMVVSPVGSSLIRGKNWPAHAAVADAAYHEAEAEAHSLVASMAARRYENMRAVGNVEQMKVQASLHERSKKWAERHTAQAKAPEPKTLPKALSRVRANLDSL